MSWKLISVLFLIACLVARLYRTRLSPWIAARFPKADAIVARGVAAVEDLATHELAQVLADRLKADGISAQRAADAAALVAKLQTALDPGPAVPKA
ncbi:MAG: hypothetical protein JWN86_3604 [Planctomycetota bacterium]|nr:hypothetical protein [Planctomycetota bacterium]